MGELNIYFSDISELAEHESSSKGYRTDVYVEIGGDIFNVKIYAMLRLQQDFESEMESYGFYTSEPNTVLVRDVNKEVIISTIRELYKQKYFEGIRPVNNIEASQLCSIT